MSQRVHRATLIFLLFSGAASAAPPLPPITPSGPGEKEVARAVRQAAAEALRPGAGGKPGLGARVDSIIAPALEHQVEEIDRTSEHAGVLAGADQGSVGLDGKVIEPEITFRGAKKNAKKGK